VPTTTPSDTREEFYRFVWDNLGRHLLVTYEVRGVEVTREGHAVVHGSGAYHIGDALLVPNSSEEGLPIQWAVCSSTDPTDHQGGTCPIHEEASSSEAVAAADDRALDVIAEALNSGAPWWAPGTAPGTLRTIVGAVRSTGRFVRW